jgi:hypothetical protein
VDSLEASLPTGAVTGTFRVFEDVKWVREGRATDSAIVALRRLLEDRQNRLPLTRAFAAVPQHDPSGWQRDTLTLVSNESKSFQFVDYSKPYYLNTRNPFIGSANVSAELSAQGTLTKATAEISDQTLSTVLGLLPVKEVLTSVLVPSAGPQAGLNPRYTYKLTDERVPVLHTLAIVHDMATVTCSPRAPIGPGSMADRYSYTRTLPGSAGKAAEENANAITLSGQINLPKKP